MRKYRKLTAVALSAFMVFSMSACSNQEEAEETTREITVTAEEVINGCVDAFADVDQLSMDAGYHMEATATVVETTEMSFTMSMDTQVFIDSDGNSYIEGTSKSAYDDNEEEQDSIQYTVINGKKVENYYNVDDTWSFEVGDYDEKNTQLYKQKTMISQLADYIDKMTVEAEETVNDQLCYVAKGEVDSTFLNAAMNSATGDEDSSIDEFLSSIDGNSIPVSVWVSEDTKMPVKLVLDLSDVMEDAMNEATKDMGITYEMKNMDITFVYTGFDVDTITVPQEALEAAE